MARTVLIPISDNTAYSPEQISTSVTLQSMLEAVQKAVNEFGADAKVLLHNGEQQAGFGSIQAYFHEVVISDADPDGEVDEDLYGPLSGY